MGLVDGEKLYVKAGDESHKALHVESLWCNIEKSQAAVAQSINGLPIFFCALGRIKAASLYSLAHERIDLVLKRG